MSAGALPVASTHKFKVVNPLATATISVRLSHMAEHKKTCPPRRRFIRRVAMFATAAALVLAAIGTVLYFVQDSIQEAAVAKSRNTKSAVVDVDAAAIFPNKEPAAKEAGETTSQDVSTEPVVIADEPIDSLDAALRLANRGLEHMRSEIRDYTCVLAKRQRSRNGTLGEEQFMATKIRCRKVDADGEITVPLSVYMKFLKPKSMTGREVIWVENQNNGKLIVHEPGIKNLLRFRLNPTGLIAMFGQRYPLSDIGMEQLIVKLMELCEQERDDDEMVVSLQNGAMVGDDPCTIIQIRYAEKNPAQAIHLARIFFDDERMIPVRYAAYLWPDVEDGEPPLDEEYTFQEVKLNVGLTDADFDPDNPDYNFP